MTTLTYNAIYMLTADAEQGNPVVSWSRPYDRGTVRKPGKLAWGSGASPTFFGPNGSDYVMLTDSADAQESVIVYRTSDGKEMGRAPPLCP